MFCVRRHIWRLLKCGFCGKNDHTAAEKGSRNQTGATRARKELENDNLVIDKTDATSSRKESEDDSLVF